MTRSPARRAAALAALVLLLCQGRPTILRGDTWTWTGASGTTLTWSNGANWSSAFGSVKPPSDGSADIEFPGSASVPTLPGADFPWSINSLFFSPGSNAFMLNGSQLTIGGGGIVSNNISGSGVTINTPIVLGSPQTWAAAASTAMTLTGSVNINSQKLTFDGGGAINFNGPIAGSGQLILNGAGSVTFGGSAPNTYSGTLQVNNGTLYLNKPNATNAVGGLTIGSPDGGAGANALVQLETSNQIGDSSTVVINSTGELYIPNGTQEYITQLVLNGGFVNTGTAANCFLGFIHNNGFVAANSSTAPAFIEGVLNLNDDSSHFTTFDVARDAAWSGIDLNIYASVQAGGITKTGVGTMLLGGSNTFAGGVNLNAGTIFVDGNSAGSSGSITSGPLGTGTLTMADQTTIEAIFGDYTLANAINIPTAGTAGIIDGPSNLTLTGTLSGAGGLIKNGAGTLTFNAATNRSLGGGLTINNGAVVLNTGLPGGLTIGGNLAVGAISGQTATLSINNASLVQNGATNMIVGATGSGAATVNVGTTATGTLMPGSGGLTINPTGSVTIGSGSTPGTLDLTHNGNVLIDGGKLEVDGGSVALSFIPANSIHIQNGGTLTTAVSIPMTITGDGTTSSINITGNNVTLGTNNGSSYIGFSFQGVLNDNAHSLTLLSNSYAQLGAFTYLNTGTITAPGGVSLPAGSWLVGGGRVNGRVVGEPGAIASVPIGQTLELGDSTSPAGFNFGGELRVGSGTITLDSSGPATLGNLTSLSSGTLNAANGFVENFGGAITGYGTINSSNTLALHSVANGVLQGVSPSQQLTLTGWIKGAFTWSNVNWAGTMDPGFSPTIATGGNIAFANTGALNIDLGGTIPGSQYDQVDSSGVASLAGTLNLVPYGGFVPVSGDKFTVMTYTSETGTFASVTGTSPAPGLTYSAVYLPTSLVIITTTNGEKTWGADASGNSSLGSNWIGGVAPGGVGDTATFSTIITAPRTVTVDADTTVGTLKFDSPISYTITGSHNLTLQAAGASAASINVLNAHGNGAHTISPPITLASDLNIIQNASGTLRITGPLNDAAAHTINKSGTGVAEIDGVPTFGAGTNLTVTAGTLRFGLASGTATVGAGVQATVSGAGTIELAGAASALSSGVHRANVLDSSSALVGLLVSGTNQQVGNIDGSGTTQINPGSDLTANHIIQAALVIGGTASSRGTVTIAPSDSGGNPLGQIDVEPTRIVTFSNVDSQPASPLSGGGSSTASLLVPGADVLGSDPVSDGVTADSGTLTSGPAAVPEPSALLLIILGGILASLTWRCLEHRKTSAE